MPLPLTTVTSRCFELFGDDFSGKSPGHGHFLEAKQKQNSGILDLSVCRFTLDVNTKKGRIDFLSKKTWPWCFVCGEIG